MAALGKSEALDLPEEGGNVTIYRQYTFIFMVLISRNFQF